MSNFAVSFRLEGTEALVKKLRGMSSAARRKAVREAALKGAKPIFEAIKRRVPADTGLLRDSLKMRVYTKESQASVRITPDKAQLEARGKGKTGKDGTKSKRAPYSVYQEFGTKRHPAQPFMMPGFDEGVRPAEQAAHQVFRAMVDEETR